MEGGERVDHGGGSHRQRRRRPEGLRRLWGEHVDDDDVDDDVDDGQCCGCWTEGPVLFVGDGVGVGVGFQLKLILHCKVQLL